MFRAIQQPQDGRMPEFISTRRRFLGLLATALISRTALAAPLRALVSSRYGPGKHPTPRPGITAARILTANQLHDKKAAPVFALVREIPEVVDGIHCYCGCASEKSFYSLLSCFESDGMAQHCHICQGEARLVHKLHASGRSLNSIRNSVDAAYGDH
jgi:hypothetical protein